MNTYVIWFKVHGAVLTGQELYLHTCDLWCWNRDIECEVILLVFKVYRPTPRICVPIRPSLIRDVSEPHWILVCIFQLCVVSFLRVFSRIHVKHQGEIFLQRDMRRKFTACVTVEKSLIMSFSLSLHLLGSVLLRVTNSLCDLSPPLNGLLWLFAAIYRTFSSVKVFALIFYL